MTPHGKQLALWQRAWLRVARDRGIQPTGAKVPACTEEERTLLSQLWELVYPDIEKEARRSRYNWISNVTFDRVVFLFELVMFELLAGHVPLDDPLRLPALLRKVARRRAIDEYRKLYGRRTAPDPRQSAPESHAASLAPLPPLFLPLEQFIDMASLGHEDALIANLDSGAVARLILERWSALPWPDNVIMRLRWVADPPRPFLSIAHHLGPGWTEEAVRKRHQRVLNKTRDDLQGSDRLNSNLGDGELGRSTP